MKNQRQISSIIKYATLLFALIAMFSLCPMLLSCEEKPEAKFEKNPAFSSGDEDTSGDKDVDASETDVPLSPKEPEASRIPQVEKVCAVVSNVDSLSVRAGAGTGYKRLWTIDKGDALHVTERVGEWYKVGCLGGTGYVFAAHVSEFGFVAASETTERVIAEGAKLLGTPYVYGAQRYHRGNGVKNNNFGIDAFDCSSLMQYIFKIGADVNLDVTSRAQSVQGSEVKREDIKRGDLLFFTNDSRVNKTDIERIGHVGLYLGDNYILHTASDYAVIEKISSKRWSYFVCARRVIK